MSLTKRGTIWYYKFKKYGKWHKGTTGQTSKKKAREFEDKVKTDLAMARIGMTPQKRCPTLQEFLGPGGKFLTHVEQNIKNKRTADAYRGKAKQLLLWDRWRDFPLSEITGDLQNDYKAYRRPEVGEWCVRNDLTVLRIALILAEEWKLIPRIKVKPGKEPDGREFTVSLELEDEYLVVTSYPYRHAGILMLDLGLRPEEAVRVLKTDIDREQLTVQRGKTKNARRALPLTKRAQETIEELKSLFPDSEWLFPSPKGGHYRSHSLDKGHNRLRRKMGWPEDFDIYAFRHTFGTQLAASGASPADIMRLMGHADIRTSMRYIHPTGETLTLAMKRREAYAATRVNPQTVSKYPQKSDPEPVND